jgi:hypothetical protein
MYHGFSSDPLSRLLGKSTLKFKTNKLGHYHSQGWTSNTYFGNIRTNGVALDRGVRRVGVRHLSERLRLVFRGMVVALPLSFP